MSGPDELLRPAVVGRDEAVRRCRDWLRRRWGLRSLGLLLLPRPEQPDLVALAAWWESVAALGTGSDARSGLDTLTRELA